MINNFLMRIKQFLIVIFVLLFVSLSGDVFAQVDYFSWVRTGTDLNNRAVSPNSGIVVDSNNRIYYIDKNNLKVCSNFGVLNENAPLARSNSNLVYRHEDSCDYIFYIGNDNKIKSLIYDSNKSNLGWTYYAYSGGSVANGSFIECASNNQIFYINSSDNRVYNYWKNSNGSGFDLLNKNSLPAKSWSNIIYKDYSVYYVANNGKLAGLTWSFTTNSWELISLQSDVISEKSRILVFDKNNIFYVRSSDSRIGQYWKNSLGSGYGAYLPSSSPVMVGSPIVSRYWNDINYVGVDGNIHCLYWDYSIKKEYVLNYNCKISNPQFAMNSTGAFCFYSGNGFCFINSPNVDGFVYKKGTKLFLDNALYTPFLINYLTTLYSFDDKQFFVGPCDHYSDDWRNVICKDEQVATSLLEQHFKQISEMGFKAIRFNGLTLYVNPYDANDPELYVSYIKRPSQWPYLYKKLDDEMTKELFNVYDKVFALCDKYGLKVNFFIGPADGAVSQTICHDRLSQFLVSLASRYKNDKRIFCYSTVLEPDVENKISCKSYIESQTQKWYNAIRQNDPNHLITIGLFSGSSSLLSWDPAIIAADFLTFHLYPFGDELLDQTFEVKKQELKWISNTMIKLNKPWIIGETSMPGSRIPLSSTRDYDFQRKYGLFMRDNVFACGGVGLTWWNYRDVCWPGNDLNSELQLKYGQNMRWDNFINYTGVITHDGLLKPIVGKDSNIFKDYSPSFSSATVTPRDYYHQNIPNPAFTMKGRITDRNGIAIDDAIIRGFEIVNDEWKRSSFTMSDAMGNYTLKSTHPVNVVQVSALGREVVVLGSNSKLDVKLNEINCAIPFNSFEKIDSNIGKSNEWTLNGNCDGSDVAYLFTVFASTTVKFSTCSPKTNFETKLEVFKKDRTSLFKFSKYEKCIGLSSSEYNFGTTLVVTLVPGDYYVVVDGVCGVTGTFELQANSIALPSNVSIVNPIGKSKDQYEGLSIDDCIVAFPNPTNGILNVKSDYEIREVVILNIQGEVLKYVKPTEIEQLIKVDLSDLKQGVYVLKTTTSKGVNSQLVHYIK